MRPMLVSAVRGGAGEGVLVCPVLLPTAAAVHCGCLTGSRLCTHGSGGCKRMDSGLAVGCARTAADTVSASACIDWRLCLPDLYGRTHGSVMLIYLTG